MTVWATRADQVDLRGPNPHDLARSPSLALLVDRRGAVARRAVLGRLERQGTVDEGVPRHRTHDAVDADADRLLEGPHRALGLGPEDAVYLEPLGRVTRQVPGLELALNGPDGVTAAAVGDLDDQRRPGLVAHHT